MGVKIGRVRYLTCSIVWLTLFTFYAMRSNISIAILSMSKHTSSGNISTFSSCANYSSNQPPPHSQEPEFNWTQAQQGHILGSFFVGYLLTHLLGAVMSHIIGPRWVMIISLFGATVFTYLMLFLPFIGVNYFILGRMMIGVFSGPLYPIVHELIAHYSPVEERTILTVITHTGNIIGLCVNFVVGGYIVEHFSYGWKLLFLMNGMLGTLCLIICVLFLYSSPEDNPLMTEEEKILIMGVDHQENKAHKRSLKEIPILKMMSNAKVLQICLSQFGNSMIIFAQLTGYPKYLSNVYGQSKLMASIISVIPFMSNFFAQILYPFIFDFGKMSHVMSKTTYRRISSAIAIVGAAAFLIPVGLVPCKFMPISVLFVSLSMVFLAANQSGFFTAMIDISPSNVGFIMSFASMFGSLSGILQPQIVSYFTRQGDLKEGYMLVFHATAIISLVMGLPFVLFGTSEEIHWNTDQPYKAMELQHIS